MRERQLFFFLLLSIKHIQNYIHTFQNIFKLIYISIFFIDFFRGSRFLQIYLRCWVLLKTSKPFLCQFRWCVCALRIVCPIDWFRPLLCLVIVGVCFVPLSSSIFEGRDEVLWLFKIDAMNIGSIFYKYFQWFCHLL